MQKIFFWNAGVYIGGVYRPMLFLGKNIKVGKRKKRKMWKKKEEGQKKRKTELKEKNMQEGGNEK
jgi:hypothetical protein